MTDNKLERLVRQATIKQNLLDALDDAFTPNTEYSHWRVDAEHVKHLIEALVLLEGERAPRVPSDG